MRVSPSHSMSSLSRAALAALVALSACTENTYYTTRDEPSADAGITPVPGPGANTGSIDEDEDEDDDGGNAQDAGSAPFDAGIDHTAPDSGEPQGMDSGIANGTSAIRITVPSAFVTRVTATVSLQMAVQGAPVDYVDLWVDGSLLASLPLPYQLAWDTSYETEGPHTVVAKAMRGGVTVAETSRELVVDRTPPELVRMIPESGTKALSLDAPLVLVFSEAIAADSILDTISIDVAGRPQAFTAALQADPSRVELRLARPAPLLPATATITLSSGIRDLAGSPLRKATPLTAAFPSWRELGPAIIGAGGLGDLASDGKVLWALLRRYDDVAKVTTLSATQWDDASRTWLTEPVTSTPLNVSASLLTIDGSGLPVVFFQAREGETPTQYFLRRREADGSWTDLTLPSDFGAPSWVGYLITEPSGSLLLAPSYSDVTKLYRLRSGVWQPVATPVPATGLGSVSVSELGLAIAFGTSPCRVQREGPTGWVDMGSVQAGVGCSAVSLFARPGSNLGVFVRYSVTNSNNNTTHSYAVFEHAGGTKWLAPTFGVPELARSAMRSQNDLLFIAPSESSIYDRLAEPMVRTYPASSSFWASERMVVWEGAPVVAYPQNSGVFFPFPPSAPVSESVQVFELNHIK